MKYLFPLVFFLFVGAIAWCCEYRARASARAVTCIESARILVPNANGHECAPGANVSINVIQLGHGEDSIEYAAVQCTCPGASLWMARLETR